MRSGVLREVRRFGVLVVASGTVLSGIGLLDLLVRPGTIERVETLGLLGVAGLIVLPPLTLAMGALGGRRRGEPAVGSGVSLGSGTAVPASVPVGGRGDASALATAVPAGAMERRVARVARARSAAEVRATSPRRAEAGALMSAVAGELTSASPAVAEIALPAVARPRARVMQHDGHRRDASRRRAGLEGEGPRVGALDLSDSMLGFDARVCVGGPA